MVASMVATSFSFPPLSATTSPAHTVMVRPGLVTRPPHRLRPVGGRGDNPANQIRPGPPSGGSSAARGGWTPMLPE
jgi:hypothetical protein